MIDRNKVKAKAANTKIGPKPQPRWDEHYSVIMQLLSAQSEEDIDRLLPAFPKACRGFRNALLANKQPGRFVGGAEDPFRDPELREALNRINLARRESLLEGIADGRADLTAVLERLTKLNHAQHVVRSNIVRASISAIAKPNQSS
jgi:hypothetical protein